jgi:hypothetical protein
MKADFSKIALGSGDDEGMNSTSSKTSLKKQ